MRFHSSWALVVIAATTSITRAEPAPPYEATKREIEARRGELAVEWATSHRRRALSLEVEQQLIDSVRALSQHWLGTRWGLGAPQTSEPQEGKVNCGTFVGTVLRDAGFRVHVTRLQRQPSQSIIASFVSGQRVRKFHAASMETFLDSMKEMGPGLFVIGLDFHVGFLVQTDTDLRFIHASFETKQVVDEPAATATPIVSSRYRIVGKLLTRHNLEDWLNGAEIEVVGKW